MNKAISTLLYSWIEAQATPAQLDWLQQRKALLTTAGTNRDLHISLGLIPRKMGRSDLILNQSQTDNAQSLADNWRATGWSIDMAARCWLLLEQAAIDPDGFGQLFQSLCRTADLNESITYYKATAVLPYSEALDWQIGEGLRSNMRAVFEAITHNNPYPYKHFEQNRWNHMVLKALFVESKLAPIIGLDERANAELAHTLCDYAHERWAASRTISPELWRCVGPFATDKLFDDLVRASCSEQVSQRAAAVLALQQSPDPRAPNILSKHPQMVQKIATNTLSWQALPD